MEDEINMKSSDATIDAGKAGYGDDSRMNANHTDPGEKKAFLLRVASYQDSNPKGDIVALPAVRKAPFCSLTDMIRKAETGLETKESASQPPREDPADETEREALATFLVTVYFEQHASWQGTVCWVERQKQCFFRSELELILIMDGVLRARRPDASGRSYANRSGGKPANPGEKGTDRIG